MEKFKEIINRLICKYKGHNWMSYTRRTDSLGSVEKVRRCIRCGNITSKWIVPDKIEKRNVVE